MIMIHVVIYTLVGIIQVMQYALIQYLKDVVVFILLIMLIIKFYKVLLMREKTTKKYYP